MTNEKQSREDILETYAWIICPYCKQKHQLHKGIDAPVYWCGNELYKLQVGDEIEYDDK